MRGDHDDTDFQELRIAIKHAPKNLRIALCILLHDSYYPGCLMRSLAASWHNAIELQCYERSSKNSGVAK